MDESKIPLSPIPLTVPYIPRETVQDVAAVLTSGYLTEGRITRQCEEAFAAFVGARHAIPVRRVPRGWSWPRARWG